MAEVSAPSVLRVDLHGLWGKGDLQLRYEEGVSKLAQDLLRSETEAQLRAGSGFCEFEARAGEWLDAMSVVLRGLGDDWDTLLVLGVGGSALGGRSLVEALGDGARQVVFVDNADSSSLGRELASLNPERTVVNVISKSGRTLETVACFGVVLEWLRGAIPPSTLAQRVVVTTEAASGPLRSWGEAEGWWILPAPEDVGGRYSVFSPVGLFPALVAGVDLQSLLAGAAAQEGGEGRSEAARLAAALVLLESTAVCSSLVLWIYGDPLLPLGAWLRQLLGESLGKRDAQARRVGMLPVLARGSTDQHSQLQLYMDGPEDKAFLFIHAAAVGEDLPIRLPETTPQELAYLDGRSLGEVLEACREATATTLSEAGKPCASLRLPRLDASCLGAALQLFMRATALAGIGHEIDPFDQPGVEATKRRAVRLLGAAGDEANAG